MLEVHRRPLTVYRISMARDGRSMWYDRDATFDPIEETFAAIPMPPDARKFLAEQHGGEWLSSVDDPSLLKLWFPNQGGLFKALGFVAQEFHVTEYATLPNEVVFNRETAKVEDTDFDLTALLSVN